LKKKVLKDLFYDEDFTRVYRTEVLASHVLGYVNKVCLERKDWNEFAIKNLNGPDGTLFSNAMFSVELFSVDEKV
jgi:cell division protein FtsI/penicillin-binding protein 2